MADKPEPPYRWAAFAHWANLGVLAAFGIAGATIDPSIWALTVPVEALVLWLLPDLPPFRAAIDVRFERQQRLSERAYLVEHLWGLSPMPPPSFSGRMKGWFVTAEVGDVDHRVIERPAEFEKYLEMRDIVKKLSDMVPLAPTRITDADIARLERVINGYLRLLLACRPLGRALSELDQGGLVHDLADVDARVAEAEPTLRPVLLERRRLIESQLSRAPKLRATLELMCARVEAIPYQLRNLHSQLLTEPGTEIHGMLDDMIERNDMLADPLSDLADADAVREFLTTDAQGRASSVGRRARAAQRATKR